MSGLTSRLNRAFYHPISPFSILLSGIYSFLWGLWVALPQWDVFRTSPIFEILNWSGSEFTWGVTQILVGLALMLAAFDSLRFMKYATFAGFVSWTLISLGFAFADWHNPGMWVAGYIAATNAYMFLNVANRDKSAA